MVSKWVGQLYPMHSWHYGQKSAIRQELYDTICQSDLCQTYVQKSHRLLSEGSPQTPIVAVGICTLSMRIGRKEFRHYMSVLPKLSHSVYVGADILVRLGAQVDGINQVLWSQASIESGLLTETPENMRSGHAIPRACQTVSEFDVAIPARTAGVSVRLMILKGQEVQCSQAFFPTGPILLWAEFNSLWYTLAWTDQSFSLPVSPKSD